MPKPDRNLSAVTTAGLSRRSVMRGAVAGVGLAGAGALVGCVALTQVEGKLTKTQAEYRGIPNDGDRCGKCVFFQSPYSCQVVSGLVASVGWCNLFVQAA